MLSRTALFDFITAQKVAFIASVDDGGFPNMKAMLMPRKIDGNCFYFTTNTSSMRVAQYLNNDKAAIYFFNKGRFRYEAVQLLGTMEVLTDDDVKREIWHIGDTLYYKKGVTDPDYCVLRFTATSGRRYCDFKSESFNLEEL